MRERPFIAQGDCVLCPLTVRDQGLNETRACNFHSDCTVSKILIVAKNSDKCVGGAKRKPFSSPVNATLEYWVSVF